MVSTPTFSHTPAGSTHFREPSRPASAVPGNHPVEPAAPTVATRQKAGCFLRGKKSVFNPIKRSGLTSNVEEAP